MPLSSLITSVVPTSPAWMMRSQPCSAASACGRMSPWVSEMTPTTISRSGWVLRDWVLSDMVAGPDMCDLDIFRGTPAQAPALSLVPDVLQEPFGRDFAAEAGLSGELINLAGDGEELRALQVAALRIGDLVVGSAALDPALGKVGERHAPARR